MKPGANLFFEAPCLTPYLSLSGATLHNKWFKTADKRYLESTLQKFVEINKTNLSYLDIRAEVVGTGISAKLVFCTGSYTGAIPLRSPVNGKQIGDFAIHPRFISGEKKYDEYVSILNLLETEVLPEYLDTIYLASSSQLRPPLYFHASEYIRSLTPALKQPWRKFRSATDCIQEPKGVVNWGKKYENSYNPSRDLYFDCRLSELSFNHAHVQELRYVYDLAVAEVNSPQAPLKLRYELLPQIEYLAHRLENIFPQRCNHLKVHYSDPKFIKSAKNRANELLDASVISSKGWRIDFSLVFERFAQHLFLVVSKSNGMQFLPNYKFNRISSNSPSWSQSYLEPDGVLIGEPLSVVIDAKYKAHMFNLKNQGDVLAAEHRLDLHQILAYSSFLTSEKKLLFLCYPSNELIYKELKYKNPVNRKVNSIMLLGVPLQTSIIHKARLLVNSLIAKNKKAKD